MYLRLEAGTYKLLLLSNAFDEFGSIHFDGQTSFGNVVVRADNLTSRMNQAWDRGVKYMKTPDVLGVALDTLTVTQEDIDKNRHFIDWRQRFAPDTISIVHRETVYPITSRLNLYVRVQGYKFMRSLEGSISGMADGCYLSRFQNTNEYGPHFLDSWTHRVGTRQDVMKPENTAPGQDPLPQADSLTHDWLFTSIPVFGLPGSPEEGLGQRDPQSNVLTLCFTLVDGTTHVYSFEVGDLFRYKNASVTDLSGTRRVKSGETAEIGLNLVIDLPQGQVDLPYAEDSSSSSGSASSFDVVVDDWEGVKHRQISTVSLMYRDGLFKEEELHAELGEILLGKKRGRENEEEIIYFNSVGLGAEDLAVVTRCYRKALKEGGGTIVPYWE